MTMTKDEALKLALSTLDEVRQETFRLIRDGQTLYAEDKVWSTIISIKEVLAQEQEPVAWEQFYPDFGKQQLAFNSEVIGYVAPQRTWVGLTYEEKHEIRYSHMTSAEFIEFIEAKLKAKNERLEKNTWVGLTYEEKHEIRYSHMTSAEFIEFIEAKLKEKNTRGQE